MRIKDLPISERPREKALRYGIESLSNIEVLALIVSQGVKGSSALDIASLLISGANGIHNLTKMSLDNVQKIAGLSRITALRLMAVFEVYKRLDKAEIDALDERLTAEIIFKKYKEEFATASQEQFIIVLLNRRGQFQFEKRMYKGTADRFPLSVSEIIGELLSHNCSSFIIVHNHPNGKIEPSDDDLIATKVIAEEAAKLRIFLRDHVIISEHAYFSFSDRGLIKTSA
ncbi:MAG: DNA repair protein RadC [Bacilli bacterium]